MCTIIRSVLDGITVYLIASEPFISDNEYLFPKNNCDKSRFIQISEFGERTNCVDMNNYVDKAMYQLNETLYDFYRMKNGVNNCFGEYVLNCSCKSKSMMIDSFGICDCFPIAFIVHIMAARIVNNLLPEGEAKRLSDHNSVAPHPQTLEIIEKSRVFCIKYQIFYSIEFLSYMQYIAIIQSYYFLCVGLICGSLILSFPVTVARYSNFLH